MNRFCTISQRLLLFFSLVLLSFAGKAQTTLVPGDIAITGYQGFGASATTDEFSFVLLRNITANTVINFTDNGWLSTNVFRTGETTVTWTAATALNAGTEVKIAGLTPTLAGAGNPGTVTGTALSLSANGDQVLAYQGTAAAPTFITAIHMNVYSLTNSDPVTTTAAAWDGTANTLNSSAVPTGLTNGTTAIWIGTQGDINSEKDNARFVCAGDLSTIASIKGLIFDQTKWTTSDGDPSGLILPTGCSYITAAAAPTINTNPASSAICAGANTSFSITATGAVTYQWQVDNGGGFANITNDVIYTGATTTTLNITAAPASFNSYQYRCVASNGTGSTNSTAGVLTVTPLPGGPTLLAKTPATATVADGTPVSATFNPGSGGTGCTDDFRYTTNGGASYLPYTPGSNISTTGLAAAGGTVTIEGRRANCSAGCQGNYIALASWVVTPLPAGATTLNAGDIAFSSYAAVTDEFSFVLLRNIGPGTVVNFTNNGWLSTNVFRTGEESVTWTSNAAYGAGTEIRISGLAATLASGGSAGTVTGTAITLNINGDQILAYRGTAAAPTFISAIHMNVYSISGGDAVNTTAAAWDGTAASSINASALPTGLTTGTNAIWIGTQGVPASEFDNSRYGNCAGPGTLGPIATLRAALNNQANWISNNNSPTPGFAIPTGCNYLGIGTPPNITGNPANANICAGDNASFTVTATGASTYQWQVNTGAGFNNITDDAINSGSTTATLNLTATPLSYNGYLYQCIVSNGSGSSTSTSATLTVTALPAGPVLASKTPSISSVADGTPVSAAFNAGSGGTGCADDFRYTTDGGATYLSYTPGANISTTGLAAGSGWVFIEGRRANCSAGCQGSYAVLASWYVTPLPAAPTTLNAGDIGFTGYTSTTAASDFSFVLLRNVGAGTTINFTDNGWLSTNVFRAGETTVTWTAPAGGLTAGTEITIAGLTATKAAGGAAGTVTGTALALSQIGDQILAYRGTAAAPTFISAIHMNVYSTTNSDPVTTTAAAWDGTANTTSSSALPTGLTTGVNAIWIGTQGVVTSEFMNARYGNCSAPGIAGPFTGLRAALNNQVNWIRNNNTPPGFTLPVDCNFFGLKAPSINVTATLTAFTSCVGTASAEQNFTVSGSSLTASINITAPAGFEISTTSGSGFAASLSLTQSGGTVSTTTIYVRMAASATGTPSGNITLASTGAPTGNVAVTGTVNPIPPTPTITAGGPTTFCAGGSVTLTSSSATGNLWSTAETTPSITVTTAGTYTVTVTSAGCTSAASAGTTVTVNPLPATPTITAGGPTTFCTGGSVTLTSSSATGNLWSTGATTASITVTTAGTYTVTVTSAGCTSAPSAGTTVTLDPLPTTANAGPDATACISPGTFTMAANVPAVGTGAWSQVPGGPATAIIFTTGSATTNIGGLTTAGTYTFVWTISSGACLPSRDTMTITVNGNPAPFTLTGGGTFCPGTTTLTGPVLANHTYTWQRSLTGIANPNSFTATGGTASTEAVTASGNYRLIVTNQFGCSASDTTPVSMADFVFNGSLATGDAQQTGRLNRFATLSTCAAPKACPLTFTTTGARFFDSYNITNPRSVPVCATIGLRSDCGTSLFNVAYLGSYNPTSLCTNYLADPGSSFPGTGYMEVTIPANATIVVVVHEVNPATGCAGYQLTVDLPRETGITVNPATPVCSGTPVSLTAPLASSYSWNPGGNTTPAISVSPTVTSKYFVTLGYGNVGCTTLDSATVVVNQLPTTALAGNDTATCGLTINNLAANTAAVGTGTWTLVTGPGTVNFSNANAPNSSAAASVNGVYTLRWTIATGGACPNSSQDDVLVNFAATPSTADAGLDKTACVSPGSVAMTAAVPTAGTGVWTQVAGPVTANIISPTAPNTNITGLNTVGTYTFRWTVSNSPCPSNFDEVNVVVNGNPASFTITGGGTFCPTGTTLVGPVNPNYTYQWGKSYLTAPFANLGTAQTEAVTSSGIYQLVVTNQFGCSTSATTVVNAADYVFAGSLATGDATQTGRLNRFAAISTCAAPKACPNTFTTTGSRLYDSYTITNPRPVPVCAVIGLNSGCGTAIFSAAYSNSYDPNNLCTNYLADPGSSPSTSIFYEATIPANGTIVVVVHEVNPGTGCANYSLTVDVPRDGAPIVVNPPSVTCASTATLTAPTANSYLWTPGGATTRSVTTPPLFVDTKYKVTLGYGNNGCNRVDSATVTVTSLPPTISCPLNINANNTPGICGRAVTYTPTVGGLPAPAITYAFAGATVASGSGDGSGAVFNVGVTTVTLTATNACGSVNCSFTVTINDNQPPTVTCPAAITVCGAASVPAANIASVTGVSDNCAAPVTVTFIGDVSTPSATAPYTITRTYRATDGAGNFTECTQIITVNPIATVGAVANQALCNGTATAAVNFTSTATGGTIVYNWTNSNASIGLAASGSGNIASFTGTNTTNIPQVATVTVTPSYTNAGTTCTGTPLVFSITVNPTPVVSITPAGPVTICNGSTATFTASATCTRFAFSGLSSGLQSVPANASAARAVFSGTYDAATRQLSLSISFDGLTGGNATAAHIHSGAVGANGPVIIPFPAFPAATSGTYTNTFTVPAAQVANLMSGNTYINIHNAGFPGGEIRGQITNLQSNVYSISGPIAATQSVPANASTATGNYGGTYNAVTNQLTLNLIFNNLTGGNATAAHIHNGAAGTNGPVIIPFAGFPAAASGSYSNTFTVPAVQIANLLAGNTYINIHNAGFPGGEIRGQVTAPAAVCAAPGYLWSTGATTASITVSTANTYTVTVTDGNGCSNTASAVLIVNPIPTVDVVTSQVLCNGTPTTAVTFTGAVPGTVYNWTNNTTSIGLGASGTGNIPSFTATNTGTAPVTATITVTPIYINNGVTCTGTAITFNYTVNPTATVNAVASQVLCNGTPTTAVTFSSPTTGGTIVYNWANNTTSIGLGASGSGDIASFTATNTGTAPVVATITVTPSFTNAGVTCVGTPITYTYTVNPTATVNAVANQVLCNGTATTGVAFSSPTTGGTIVYNWTNNTTSIGLAASGSGNIPSFTATNTGTAPVVATITVTPTFTNASVSCVGTPITYTYTVNPTAVVNAVTNQVVCNGSPTTAVTFGTTATGGTVVYNWTNNTTSIGLGASGTGNIPSFTAINTGTAPVVATITVTPTFTNAGVSCVGTPLTYTYTVNPTAVVNAVASQVLCNATPTAAVNFSSPNTGGTMTYNWTNNTPSIGLAASGTGNIPSFTAINTGIVPVTATITVTPSFTNGGVTCTGAAITFTIQVKPTPTVNAVTSQAVCNGFPTTAVNFTGAVAGTTFSWTNNVTSIGLAASGTGNIASFTGINTSNNPIVATITVTPSVNGCTGASITFTITVNPQPTVTLSTPLASILPNQTTSVIATTNPPGGNYLWFLNNSQLVTPPATPVITPVTVDRIGVYKVIYTDLNGCVTASSTLEIKGSATDYLWVYPNPNNGQFVVRFYNQPGEQVTVNVYDAIGQIVFQKRVVTGTPYTRLDVDLRNKAAGYYMVNVVNGSNKTLATKRVLVSH